MSLHDHDKSISSPEIMKFRNIEFLEFTILIFPPFKVNSFLFCFVFFFVSLFRSGMSRCISRLTNQTTIQHKYYILILFLCPVFTHRVTLTSTLSMKCDHVLNAPSAYTNVYYESELGTFF